MSEIKVVTADLLGSQFEINSQGFVEIKKEALQRSESLIKIDIRKTDGTLISGFLIGGADDTALG